MNAWDKGLLEASSLLLPEWRAWELLAAPVSDPEEDVAWKRTVPTGFWELWRGTPDVEAQCLQALGRNHFAPQGVILALAQHSCWDVRRAAAESHLLGEEVAHHLSHDRHPTVVLALAANPTVPASVLGRIAVRGTWGWRSSTAPLTLEYSRQLVLAVGLAVAANPAASPRTVAKLVPVLAAATGEDLQAALCLANLAGTDQPATGTSMAAAATALRAEWRAVFRPLGESVERLAWSLYAEGHIATNPQRLAAIAAGVM